MATLAKNVQGATKPTKVTTSLDEILKSAKLNENASSPPKLSTKDAKKLLDKVNKPKGETEQDETLDTGGDEDVNTRFNVNLAKSLFGRGFTTDDYREMMKRLEELKNNYAYDRSAMHKEALHTYVKYAYKRDEAIANDDMDAADKWGKLAARQASDAKINPSQLSAADLSDGMSSFSQLSAAVERAQDVIPLLPKYLCEPQDAVDFVLWEQINYLRRLENKPIVKYKDLYKYLIIRVENFNKRYPDRAIDLKEYYDYDNDENFGGD